MSEVKGFTMVKVSIAVLLLGQGLLVGCDAPPEVDEDVADSGDVEGGDDEAVRAWTSYTSEEYPPLICPYGQVVNGAFCTGSYCDNIALYCSNTSYATGWTTWLTAISEESSWASCYYSDMWMTGIDCAGSYCDNISIRCSQMVGSSTGACQWSGWFSEENGAFFAPWGSYVKAVICDGSYCDNKAYYYCTMN